MTAGVLWSLVAAVGFAFLQASNRKSNQIVGAYRTAFGLLVAVEILLIVRAAVTGELGLIAEVPAVAVWLFSISTFFHFVGGWTLLALSQQRIGVARTGALVAAAPLVGTLLAALVLEEPLTVAILSGVLLAVAGVTLISLSGNSSARGQGWREPWFALTVATIWGASPMLIRIGFEHFPHPVLGLTIGLGVTVPIFGVGLAVAGVWRQDTPAKAIRWMGIGGVAGVVAVSAQWISFDLTTIAIAITVQQLSALVIIALVPIMFREPFERMNVRFFFGTAAMLAGSVIVVLA